uniref:RxLR effector protein n=1 Tax=Chromera velia CCMP2878 TaxID=1169474 RepID=A0A0G4I9E3_9ALVE|eukprot:Cvel_12241.t1-p1 / transcript=Cvel_12241.t1 / gene=Cvel_12241 / organism=Chromera_velia_CCMP2878 / gene_product=hypothetical protein / transcript_product=hypothetical protein / location=Cvel_scaffold793:4790-5578(+) / protein_length=263 / sequence_SO=supercontig / SO=protein_coding / is_pseudo=false
MCTYHLILAAFCFVMACKMNEAVTIGSGNHPVFLAKRLTPHHQHASSSINISKEAAEINNLGAISVLLQKEKASDENEQQEAQTQDALAQWKAKNKGQFDPDDMKFDDPLWYEAYMVWYAQQEDTQKNNEEAEIKRSNSKKALTDHNPFAEWMEQTNFAHWYCLSDIDKMAEYLELDRPACGKDTREGCQALTGYMIKAAKEQGHPDKPFFLECVAKKNDDDDCRMVLKNNAQKYLDLFPYKDTKHVELAMDYHVANPFWDGK